MTRRSLVLTLDNGILRLPDRGGTVVGPTGPTGPTGPVGPTGPAGPLAIPAISLSDVAGGTALPLATIVSIPWDTQRFIDGAFFAHVPPSPLVTVLVGGRYKITFNITPTMIAGAGAAARSTVIHAVLINGAIAAGTNLVYSYHRLPANGTQTATLSSIELILAAGDVVSAVSFKSVGTSTIVVSGGASSLLVERVGS